MAAAGSGEEREAILKVAIARVALLAHLTPAGFEAEVARVAAGLRQGRCGPPLFEYARPPSELEPLAQELESLARRWRAEGAVAELYADKADEVALEARLCDARERGLAPLAKQRYSTEPELAAEADALARAWIHDAADALETVGGVVTSDDERDPRSLVRRMRAEVGRRRLPFRVVVVRSLAPLAAVGDGVIQIAPGRALSDVDVERTVAHEIEGHALPATRALGSPMGLLRVGTSRGSDDQEGWALLVEERAGLMRAGRRAEIGLRHVASRCAHDGWTFVETLEALRLEHGDSELVARSVCRAFRGGGLGREAAYLPAMLRVGRALAASPELEVTLTSGRVSVAAARALARL